MINTKLERTDSTTLTYLYYKKSLGSKLTPLGRGYFFINHLKF